MAVKFGKDGTLYCNTVKYNWKQARNMIADGSYGNISGTSVWQNAVISTDPAGYKAYRCFAAPTVATPLMQTLPVINANHVYYLSFRFKSPISTRLHVQIAGNDSSSTTRTHLSGSAYGANNNWILQSYMIYPSYTTTSDNYIRFYKSTQESVYVNQLVLVDLTDTFGSGNEPTKEWCANNIREHEVYVNFGNVSGAITASNYNSYFTIWNGNAWVDNANYLQVDSPGDVREYQMYFQTANSVVESTLTSTGNMSLTPSNTYYFQAYERHGTLDGSNISGTSFDFYFPIAEPLLGTVQTVNNEKYNGGGGMKDWKRVSMFGTRSSFATGSYPMRVDFNNHNKHMHFWATGFVLLNASTNLTQYNSYNGTSVPLTDINKEWCDRWIDGRSSSIIHIKDPNNTTIKFDTDYDIVCNDIEIRPESDKITMDKTGTIKCKKLIKLQSY